MVKCNKTLFCELRNEKYFFSILNNFQMKVPTRY